MLSGEFLGTIINKRLNYTQELYNKLDVVRQNLDREGLSKVCPW